MPWGESLCGLVSSEVKTRFWKHAPMHRLAVVVLTGSQVPETRPGWVAKSDVSLENHHVSMGKPWENHRKSMGTWRFTLW